MTIMNLLKIEFAQIILEAYYRLAKISDRPIATRCRGIVEHDRILLDAKKIF